MTGLVTFVLLMSIYSGYLYTLRGHFVFFLDNMYHIIDIK